MSVVMSSKFSSHHEIFFDHLRIRFSVLLMCKSDIKYQYVSHAVCAYTHIFQKRPECALIEACALIRTIMVFKIAKQT